MRTPRTAQGIRDLVASLPEWDPMEENDPNWVRRATEYGYISARSASSVLQDVDVDGGELVEVDAHLIKYSGQMYIRLDALLHYLDSDDLFDREGWFGNDVPVVVKWRDGYRVLDGTHRVLADRIMGRRTKVILANF